MIDFKTKINPKRPENTKECKDADALLRQFESDRGRIINSAAVRRLQQKTQVFPLERNAAVRSRLTHSLEVQQVGRFIVQSIFRALSQEDVKSYGLEGLERHVESVVEMSCLMHDIGNPPFGHFGEQAINDWFQRNLHDSLPAATDSNEKPRLSEELERDICHFEGNAQAIRLVHTLLNLNLTYTQTAGILKYTRCGSEEKPDKEDEGAYIRKKVGYYDSEKVFVEELCNALDMQIGNRHPLSYIMEAADDISYCIADLEDAVEKHIIDLERLSEELSKAFAKQLKDFRLSEEVSSAHDLNKMLKKAKEQANSDPIAPSSQFFVSLRVSVIHPLVKHAVKRFISNIDAVYNGHFNQALLEDKSEAHAITETLKIVAREFAFCHREVESMELKGYKVISGLLNAYQPLLKLSRAQFEAVAKNEKSAKLLESRLYKKLSNKHVRAYQQAIEGQSDTTEFYYRCRLLQDYISGMTDQFALDEYRALMVID
ncbi:dGTPase [Alteromonas sp. a30]|uniref:dGTPase n=1 Tax=Alteromonas sp. a30 TaxID=2730917 RepID=UPI0022822879|nr:dGTPase [Alteromonas sp. a30]MCY7296675.1 dGTPase [Alteromonas sp. a30]